VPYTLSHIAAVLPGYRALSRAQVFSAAVIGSMVPDFGFLLLYGGPARWQTHSFAGLFTFCLPVGLGAYWLLQFLIKPAMLEVLPDRAYLRVRTAHPSRRLGSVRGWLYAAGAIELGAITHLIWDAFTHENARGVHMFPVLREYGPELDGHALQYYHWLQYGSSIVGLVLLIGAMALWWRHTPRPSAPPKRALGPAERVLWGIAYALLPFAAPAWSLWYWHTLHSAPISADVAIGRTATALMRGFVISLLLVSLLILARLRSQRSPASTPP
jgi:Domain of unknown function (DUF4184)